MSAPGRRPELSDLVQIPRSLDRRPSAGSPVIGHTPEGHPFEIAVTGRWTLLLFLSSSCDGCLALWESFAPNDGSLEELSVVFVTRAAPVEDAGAVARLRGAAPVVMSEGAWRDYEVHSGPFFVALDPGGRVATEGVAWSDSQIRSALTAAGAPSPAC